MGKFPYGKKCMMQEERSSVSSPTRCSWLGFYSEIFGALDPTCRCLGNFSVKLHWYITGVFGLPPPPPPPAFSGRKRVNVNVIDQWCSTFFCQVGWMNGVQSTWRGIGDGGQSNPNPALWGKGAWLASARGKEAWHSPDLDPALWEEERSLTQLPWGRKGMAWLWSSCLEGSRYSPAPRCLVRFGVWEVGSRGGWAPLCLLILNLCV